MENHIIVLTLKGNIHVEPSVKETLFAQVGDTLQYETDPPGLPFRVEIPSPFTKVPARVIKDRESRVLEAEGRFFWKCFMQRRSDKKFVGWFSGENPESGGDVDVRP